MSTIERIARTCVLKVTNGPSRQDMFIECEHAFDDRYLIRIDFTVEIPNRNSARRKRFKIEQISSIRHLDESGNEFVVTGKCASDNFYGRPFTARYSTLTRSGVIEVDISSDRRLSNNTFIPDLNPGLL